MKKNFSLRELLLTAMLLLLTIARSLAQELIFNEILNNPTNENDSQEFIELKGERTRF